MWSLCFEEQFYLLLIALYLAGPKRLSKYIVAAALASIAARVVVANLHPASFSHFVLQMQPHWRFDAIAWGCLAWVYRARVERVWQRSILGWQVSLLLASTVALCILNPVTPQMRVLWFAALAAVFTLLVTALSVAPAFWLQRLLAWPPLVVVGSVSYEIYLSHISVFRVLSRFKIDQIPFPLLSVELRLLDRGRLDIPSSIQSASAALGEGLAGRRARGAVGGRLSRNPRVFLDSAARDAFATFPHGVLRIRHARGFAYLRSDRAHGAGMQLYRRDVLSDDSASAQSGGGSNGGGNAGFGNTPAQFPEWTNVTSNLAGLASECGNMSFLSAKPDEDLLIAGVARVGLWSSTDGGQSWSLLGTGKGSDPLENRPSAIIYDPTHPATFWESGIYGAGVYKTTNDGRTIVRVGDVMHTDLLSIDFSDPARATFLAGGHEQANSLNLSTDSGSTWSQWAAPYPRARTVRARWSSTRRTFLVGCGGYGGGFVGIYRSTDGGAHFKELSKLGGVSPPLRTADGSIYWASGDSSLALSTDDGDTWTKMSANDVITGFTPAELPDGRIAALAQGNRGIALSADSGGNVVAGRRPVALQRPSRPALFCHAEGVLRLALGTAAISCPTTASSALNSTTKSTERRQIPIATSL